MYFLAWTRSIPLNTNPARSPKNVVARPNPGPTRRIPGRANPSREPLLPAPLSHLPRFFERANGRIGRRREPMLAPHRGEGENAALWILLSVNITYMV